MQNNVRLRVFAGPNGSGKSTLFNEFKKKYDPGYFINADDLER
jgi:predicted ABC-type ATPase